MSKHSTIRRYSLIIDKIGRKTYPSFADIRNYMYNHGFEISERTIQRDMEQIRDDFGVDILYDRQRNGYYIDDYAGFNMQNFLRFLEIANTATLITECLKESKHTIDYFDFESKGNLKGVEFIKPLLYAIRNNRKISITYEKFSTGIPTKYEIMPYMLKEYLYRWYLVGVVSEKEEFRTFGVDRIVDLVELKKTFKPKKRKDPKDLFTNIIGLTYSLNELTEVILSFSPLQGKYIKSLPLHDSQEVIIDNDTELRISLYVIPNIELKQRILMMGEGVQVIEPAWLVEEVKDSLRGALKKYGS